MICLRESLLWGRPPTVRFLLCGEGLHPNCFLAPTAAAGENEVVSDDKVTEEPAKPEEPAVDEATTSKSGSKRHSLFVFWKGEKKDTEAVKEREIVSDAPPVIAPIGEEPKETTEEAKAVDAAPAPPVDAGAKPPSSPPKESLLDKLFKPKERAAPVTAGPSTDVKVRQVPYSIVLIIANISIEG